MHVVSESSLPVRDQFTGSPTVIHGRRVPHLEAVALINSGLDAAKQKLQRLVRAAAFCDVGMCSDMDLATVGGLEDVDPEATLSPESAELFIAYTDFRRAVPLLNFERFGFRTELDNPFDEENPFMRRIGGGVEDWAYVSFATGSVYKFFPPREGGTIGSVFKFRPGQESHLHADAVYGSFEGLIDKITLINALGGMPSELLGITPEGVVVTKQTLGDPLDQGADVSKSLPAGVIPVPSVFMRADRDHPRLFFRNGNPWLVGDLHSRNMVRTEDGDLRVIDLVAAPWPDFTGHELIDEWIERLKIDPKAPLVTASRDEEL